MAQPHNPDKMAIAEGDHWRYSVTCNGTGCDGAVIGEGKRDSEHEALTAAATISGQHKLGA